MPPLSQLPDFTRARVLVVGDVMLDRYWQGETARISPEAPVPVVNITDTVDRPGGAGNVAMNLASLGAKVTLVGAVGDDEAGQSLTTQLEQAGVATHFQCLPDRPTITKLRVISRHQQLLRLDFEQPFAADETCELIERTRALLPEKDVLVLSDYAKGGLADPQALIVAARDAGVPVLVDPKGRDFNRYRGATLLTPNLSELRAIIGPWESEKDLLARARELVAELALEALLITRGEQGMTLVQADGTSLHLPACSREVFDVTGAGDTVIALLAASLVVDASLAEATRLANLAAGLVVAKLGTATVSTDEMNRAIHPPMSSVQGVINREQLPALLARARSAGERIVFTNGCFDILHAGHVAYLMAARQLGDRLLVAVNSDESVAALKGASRPINPLAQRMAVLAALGAVDWVVDFADPTPEPLLQEVRPDVLAKGGDYTAEQVVGGKWVESYGGQVVVLPMVPGCSSTDVIEKIKER